MKTQNLTTKDAIEQRRSIRRFKSDAVPDEHVMELIEAARLAPSGSNAQPWRFKIVTDEETRQKLAEAAYHQSFCAGTGRARLLRVDQGVYGRYALRDSRSGKDRGT
jgi:nitroreductase